MTEVMTMEQQEQRTLQKQTATKESSRNEPLRQEQASFTSLAVQSILDGAAVWDLPRQSLEELAGRVGNSVMLALASMGSARPRLRQTDLTGSEPDTEATAVPEMTCQLTPAADLTAGAWPSGAFDPAGLA